VPLSDVAANSAAALPGDLEEMKESTVPAAPAAVTLLPGGFVLETSTDGSLAMRALGQDEEVRADLDEQRPLTKMLKSQRVPGWRAYLIVLTMPDAKDANQQVADQPAEDGAVDENPDTSTQSDTTATVAGETAAEES
jgi:hypothetical protein